MKRGGDEERRRWRWRKEEMKRGGDEEIHGDAIIS